MTDAAAHLAAALADRYVLERKLGRGGMATVWLARDLRHERAVALKVLLPELAASLGPDRFQREIRLAARLQHPHILTIHDSGSAGGQLWYTMPYVQGESLRDRLRRERQLPLDEALGIAREVADALAYAHSMGVVHRDIKPENILLSGSLSGSHALVADFGVARALDAAEGLTETGLALGTPAYMSPEQGMADRTVDGRSDLYSLACVLYEMLAGEPPYAGASAQALLTKRLMDPVPSVRRLRETVPESVDAALQRGMAKSPADRFPDAAAFGRSLDVVATGPATAPGRRPGKRRPVPLALGAVLLVAVGLGLWVRSRGHGAAAADSRLAVLPFRNLGDTADAYFAQGLADELRGRLAALHGLQVIGTASSNTYTGDARPADVARELGVRYVLIGEVQWDRGAAGGRLRVHPELIDARTGATTWGGSYDGTTADLFQVQSDIAGRVAGALGVALGQRPQPSSPQGYDAYLRALAAGEEYVNVGAGDKLAEVHRYAHEALASDSTFGPFWAMIATSHAWAIPPGCTRCAIADSALSEAERAVQLAPGWVEGYAALTRYYGAIQDRRGQLAAAERGLRVIPDDPELLGRAAVPLAVLGRWDRALQAATRAEALDPRSLIALRTRGRILIYLRRLDELRALCRRGLVIAPRSTQFIAWQMIAALMEGDSVGARKVYEEGSPGLERSTLATSLIGQFEESLVWVMPPQDRARVAAGPLPEVEEDRIPFYDTRAALATWNGDTMEARAAADSALATMARAFSRADQLRLQSWRGLMLAYAGRRIEAKLELARALEPRTEPDAFFDPGIHDAAAAAYTLLGEQEKAVELLEGLVRQPYWLTPAWLRISPTFAALRTNPRFQRLVRSHE